MLSINLQLIIGLNHPRAHASSFFSLPTQRADHQPSSGQNKSANQTIRYFFSMANDFNPYSDPRAIPYSDPRANDFNQASSFFSMANDFNSRD